MLNYNELKNKAREFLAATGLKPERFEKLLPAFRATYEKKYPSDQTPEGKARQRRTGGGRQRDAASVAVIRYLRSIC